MMNRADESFKDFVLDQLRNLENIEALRMFGGYGLYQDETFFGILHNARIFLKVDDTTVGEYRQRRMKPFRPNTRQTLKSYYEVPAEIIEDAETLKAWAVRAIHCRKRRR